MKTKIFTFLGILCIIAGGMVGDNKNVVPCLLLIGIGILCIGISIKVMKPENKNENESLEIEK